MATQLDRKLRQVHLRCMANLAMDRLCIALLLGGAAAAAAVVVDRTFGLDWVALWHAALLCGAAAAGAAAAWLLTIPSRMQVAILIDERLAFKERLSTALALAGSSDPFARAADREAHRAAAGLQVEPRFPVRPDRRWLYTAGVWVAAAALFQFLPVMDVLGYSRQRRDKQAEQKQFEQVKADVKLATQELKSSVERLGDAKLAKELAELARMQDAMKAAELRRQAIRKLGELSGKLKDKIEALQKSERFQTAEAMQRMLRQLRSTREGLTNELNNALARGDLKRAAETLAEIRKKMEDGKLSKQETDALAKQLEDLAKQLSKQAEGKEMLEEALAKAGLDKDLAKLGEDDLREALKKAGLSDEEIKELMDKAKACQNACKKCKNLAGKLAKCSACVAEGADLGELDGLIGELTDLELLDEEMKLAKAALADCDNAVVFLGGDGEGDAAALLDGGRKGGVGAWRPGQAANQGAGTGGPGKGYGPDPTATDGQTGLVKTRSPTQTTDGPVIASRFFKGKQVKGDAKLKLKEVTEAAKSAAADAVSEHRIPRMYEGPVKKYFKKVDAPAEGEAAGGEAEGSGSP